MDPVRDSGSVPNKMSNDNIVEPTNDGLENLPENERKETEEILGEIKKGEEGKTEKPADPEKPEKPEDGKKDDEGKSKSDEDGKNKKTDGDEGKRRDSKLIPAWKVAIQNKDKDTKIGELTAEIERLTKGAKPEKGQEASPDAQKALADKIKEAVEKFNVDVDPGFMEAIVQIAQAGRELPKDVTDRLTEIDRLREKNEIEQEELGFSKDFDKIVLPLIKAEYGDDIEAEKIEELKDLLKGIAYSDEYAKIPYDEIYQGKKDFRGFVTPKKRSAEGTRKTGVGFNSEGKDWISLTKEEAEALSPDDFEKWSNAQAAAEKQR